MPTNAVLKSKRLKAFVLLPEVDEAESKELMDSIYLPALLKNKMSAIFEDDAISAGTYIGQLWKLFSRADLIIAHLSDNGDEKVRYFLGMAHALSLPVIITAPDGIELPKYLAQLQFLAYKHRSPIWAEKLKEDLAETLSSLEGKMEDAVEKNIGIGTEKIASPVAVKARELTLKGKLKARTDAHTPTPSEITAYKNEINQLKKKLASYQEESNEKPLVETTFPPHTLEKIKELAQSGLEKIEIYQYLRDQGYSNTDAFAMLDFWEGQKS